MSLLDKATIITTPTAQSNGKLHSIKGDAVADFDVVRGSAATRVNKDGLVENISYLSGNVVTDGDFSQEGSESVLDGGFSQEGSEVVLDGDFSSSASWGGGSSIADGQLTKPDNGLAYQTTLPVSVNSYKVIVDVETLGASLTFYLGGYQQPLSQGVNTIYVVSGGSNSFIGFNNGIGSVINSISVKEVAEDWILGTGWSVADGIASCDGTQTTWSILQQNNILPQDGSVVKIEGTISNYSGGNLYIKAGYSDAGYVVSSNGAFTAYRVVNGSSQFRLQADLNFVGSIDNISVKEIGQNWILGGSGNNTPTIGLNSITIASVDGNSYIQQNNALVSGKNYEITYTINSSSGSSVLKLISSFELATIPTTVGTHTILGTATTSTLYIERADTVMNATITNISILEVVDATNIPRIDYEDFTYQDALGDEEIVNGDFASGSSWDGDFTIADGQLTKTTTGTLTEYISTFPVSVNDYKVVVDVVTLGASLTIYLGGAQQSLSEGVNTIYMKSGGSNSFVGFNNGSGSVINSISVKEVLGQEVVPNSGTASVLTEPQSTNLVTYSEDFGDAAWAKSNTTITPNQGVSPDGSNNAHKYLGSTTGQDFRISVNVSSNYTCSLYVKAINSPFIRLRTNDGSCWFNMSTNAVATNTFADAEIESVGNDWYRVSITSSSFTASNNFFIHPHATDNTSSELDGAEFLLWGAQVEDKSYATSYIPTSGAIATRLADSITGAGDVSTFNDSEGVLFGEFSTNASDNNSNWINISDGTANNWLFVGRDSTNVRAYLRANNVVVFSNTATPLAENNKVALSYKSGDVRVYINGVKVANSTSAFSFSLSLNQLNFGVYNGGAATTQAAWKQVAVYNTSLTDEELTCLTTI